MICHDAESLRLMSALGHLRTLERGPALSASPPRADMFRVGINVCKVPVADIGKRIGLRDGVDQRTAATCRE